MGIACSMSRVLQQGCAAPVADPQTGDPCVAVHRDQHSMTLIVDEPPDDWVMPLTIDWGDGDTSTSADGEDAHEYALEGNYTVTATDAEGRTCSVTIGVPA